VYESNPDNRGGGNALDTNVDWLRGTLCGPATGVRARKRSRAHQTIELQDATDSIYVLVWGQQDLLQFVGKLLNLHSRNGHGLWRDQCDGKALVMAAGHSCNERSLPRFRYRKGSGVAWAC
jgi:hypothetical protein